MDENGHSPDNRTGGGGGAESRDRTLLNGWASPASPWAPVARPAEEEDDVPAWRRPSQEIRPFARQTPVEEQDLSEVRPFDTAPAVQPQSPPAPQGRGFSAPSEGLGAGSSTAPRWSDSNRRYEDLRRHFNSDRTGPPPSRFQELAPVDAHSDEDGPAPDRMPRDLNAMRAPRMTGLPRESLPRDTSPREEDMHPHPGGRVEPPTPNSAPPYPYEGDLDDTPQSRFPSIRPAAPAPRRAEPARHALEPTPFGGLPQIQPASADPGRTAETPRVRGNYDPDTFPRRLPYEPPKGGTANENTTGYATPSAYPSNAPTSSTPVAEQTARGLPQRVPAKPDVPTVPEPPSPDQSAETPALARIASHLRREDLVPPQDREEGFDVQAILAAVREVDGVRDAMLRTTPAGANSLRLDLAEGADPAEVSRQVARLLQDRMGLDAAMQGTGDGTAGPESEPVPAPAPVSKAAAGVVPPPPPAAFIPSQPPPPVEPITASAPSAGHDLRRMPTEPVYSETRYADQAPAQPQPAPTQPAPIPPAQTQPVQSRPVQSQPAQPEPPRTDQQLAEHVAETPKPEEAPRPLDVGDEPGPRVMIDNVQVTTFGTEATVEVKLEVDGRRSRGVASGPAVDGYLMRLCATAAADAINDLLSWSDRRPEGPARCFVEHAAAVPFGNTQVAVVVMLLSVGGAWVEQLAGSAMVGADARHAMVRATLAAVNRRLEALLSR